MRYAHVRQLTSRHCSHLLLTGVFLRARRAAADMDREAAASAADAPCSNRSISPARGAHSSKPAARCCSGRSTGRTDGLPDVALIHFVNAAFCRMLC